MNMKTLVAVVLGLLIVGGGAYFFYQKGGMDTGKTSFTSDELGFSLKYPSSEGALTLKTTGGGTKESSRYNFTTADGASMFYAQGPTFSSPTEGMPVGELLKACATETNGCVKKHNANNVEYYYLDNYAYVVGEMHVALVPLSGSTLVLSVQRTDSSEEASTPAEEQAFFDLLDSVRLQ